jgi:hypothetical protein
MNRQPISKREQSFIRFLRWLDESELSEDTRKDTFVLLRSELHRVPPGAAWSVWGNCQRDCGLYPTENLEAIEPIG